MASSKQTGSRRKSTGKGTARKTQRTSARSKTGRKNTKKRAVENKMEPAIKKELVILISLAVCLLLFCSNLHLCGQLGEVFYRVMRGLFGIMGYVFPVYLFVCICFLLSNRASARSVVRILVSCLVFLVLCGIVSLLALDTYDAAATLGDYYSRAAQTIDGGMAGGLCLRLLYPAFGMVGAYVILIVLAAAGIVVITEKSILRPIQKNGKKVYDTAREDMARRHEIHAARAEEKKKYRAEKKVRGVSLDTSVGGETDADAAAAAVPGAETEGKKAKGQADIFTGEIHGMTGQAEKEEDPARGKSEGHAVEADEEVIYIEEDTAPLRAAKLDSTLSELEAFDRENGGAEEDGTPLSVDYAAMDRNPVFGKQFEMTGRSAESGADESSQTDVRQVVTASGKVVEVEQDPTEEDPITRKRAQAASAGSGDGTIFREAGGARGSSGSVNFSAGKDPADSGAAKTGTKQQAAGAAKKPPRPYVKPPVSLLRQGSRKMKNRDAELRETAVKLQQTLRNFGVGVTVTNISCGPSVTRYELTPEQGVKVSRIVSLTDDIKLNLAAADIRIEAPIPGKSAVGIEVPNKENMTVFFRDVLESEEFKKHPSRLAFAVGRDIAGQTVVADLARMPHLLIAGATGSGKSVCINTLIMSIIYKAKPSEVRLIMVDPKVVELSVYNGIPHLMIPVVTDPKKAAGALNWAVAEMTDRYKKFAELNVRDLKGYNEKIREETERPGEEAETLPQLVIIVDELSDLMMVAPGEVEDAICRLAQMARAAGIHLVLATQRPSVNVITGLIKANVPSRIAFSVSSGVDSRTIIDMNGAEKLLGKGDMLFYPSGYQKPVRVQGAFISDEEVSRVVKYLTDRSDVQYSQDVESHLAASGGAEGGIGGDERDAYFADAGRFIIEKEKASIGMLQRAFKVGFNRAARIMDQLASAGVVGEEEGTKPRKVLMTREEFEEYLQQQA